MSDFEDPPSSHGIERMVEQRAHQPLSLVSVGLPAEVALSARGFPAGTVLGRYTLLQRVAVGGMAELYLARQTGIEGFTKLVALKRVLPQFAADAQFVRMFQDEARLAATLDHPNIAAVYDIGTDQGEYFYVMEYVHGRTVLEVLQTAGAEGLPLECALQISRCIAEALHYAHEHTGLDGKALGLVHRDVSPSNVLVGYGGAVKLVDFGIAKAAHGTKTTRQGGIKGKIGYMSPEQCRGEAIDRRCDIFALGILLYETTTGMRAFAAPNEFAIMAKIVKGDYIPPRELVPAYPQRLEEIIARALHRDLECRYSSAHELLLDLEDFAHEQRLRLSSVSLSEHMRALFGDPPHPSTTVSGIMAATAPLHLAKRRRWAAAGVGVAVVGALIGGTLLASSPTQTREANPTAADAPATATAEVLRQEVVAAPQAPSPAMTAATVSPPAPPEPGTAAVKADSDNATPSSTRTGSERGDDRKSARPRKRKSSSKSASKPRSRRTTTRSEADTPNPDALYPSGYRPQ